MALCGRTVNEEADGVRGYGWAAAAAVTNTVSDVSTYL